MTEKIEDVIAGIIAVITFPILLPVAAISVWIDMKRKGEL